MTNKEIEKIKVNKIHKSVSTIYFKFLPLIDDELEKAQTQMSRISTEQYEMRRLIELKKIKNNPIAFTENYLNFIEKKMDERFDLSDEKNNFDFFNFKIWKESINNNEIDEINKICEKIENNKNYQFEEEEKYFLTKTLPKFLIGYSPKMNHFTGKERFFKFFLSTLSFAGAGLNVFIGNQLQPFGNMITTLLIFLGVTTFIFQILDLIKNQQIKNCVYGVKSNKEAQKIEVEINNFLKRIFPANIEDITKWKKQLETITYVPDELETLNNTIRDFYFEHEYIPKQNVKEALLYIENNKEKVFNSSGANYEKEINFLNKQQEVISLLGISK